MSRERDSTSSQAVSTSPTYRWMNISAVSRFSFRTVTSSSSSHQCSPVKGSCSMVKGSATPSERASPGSAQVKRMPLALEHLLPRPAPNVDRMWTDSASTRKPRTRPKKPKRVRGLWCARYRIRTCGLWLRRRGRGHPGASNASQPLALLGGGASRWTQIHPKICGPCCSCAARPSCGPGPLTVGPYCGRGTRPEPGHGLRPDRPRRAAARPAEPERHPDPPRRPGGLCRQRDSLRLGIQMAVSISRTSIRGETGWG